MKLVTAPILPVVAATLGEKGDHESDLEHTAAEAIIAVPHKWCPNPAETTCLRVKGASMTPLIHDGDIVIVDSSQSDPAKLNGKIVVASHRHQGLSLARFRKVDGSELLESENRDYQPIMLSKNRQWRIMGKVLWWIREAPQIHGAGTTSNPTF